MIYLKNKTKQAGFTLVEGLIYSFLFILISSVAVGFLFSLNGLFVQYKQKQALLASGTTAMERILIEVREADNILLLKSEIASSTAGVLTLNKGADEISFRKIGDQLELYKNDSFEASLLNDSVTVEGVTFYLYTGTDDIELIRVRLDLLSTQNSNIERYAVTGGAVIRGTYEKI